jgi:hypothetical protein
MFEIIKALIKRDPDYPDRYYNLMLYQCILDGTLYDCFPHQYHQEYVGEGSMATYVPASTPG